MVRFISFYAAVALFVAISLEAASGQPKFHDSEPASSGKIRVILLGTGGGPTVRLQRFGPSTLVEAGNEKLLFDCGRGVLLRLMQAGIPLDNVTRVFLTHLHSDHIVDIPDLLLSPWASFGRKAHMEFWGPEGTQDMMDHLQRAFAFDIHIRRDVDERFPGEGIRVVSHDISQGTVYEHGGVKVTAFLVDHGPVKPAFGYRVDYRGHSLVLSGDTRYSENLARFSRGADILVHEASDPDAIRAHLDPEKLQRIRAHHITPEQAAELFSLIKPRMAVLYHTSGNPRLLAQIRAHYSGKLEMGEDLMTIEVGDEITIHRSAPEWK